MPHRQREIAPDARIVVRALVNLDQVVHEISISKLVFLSRNDVRQFISRLPSQRRTGADIIEILLRRFLLIRQVAEQEKNANADRDNDQREQEELCNEQRSWFFYLDQFIDVRD